MTRPINFPPMRCQQCGSCCGPVDCTREELQAILAYVKEHAEVMPRKQGISCPFLRPEGCAVYRVRPMVCRLFGHVDRLECKHGHDVKMHRKEKRRAIRLLPEPGQGVRLHSLVYEPEEMDQILLLGRVP